MLTSTTRKVGVVGDSRQHTAFSDGHGRYLLSNLLDKTGFQRLILALNLLKHPVTKRAEVLKTLLHCDDEMQQEHSTYEPMQNVTHRRAGAGRV